MQIGWIGSHDSGRLCTRMAWCRGGVVHMGCCSRPMLHDCGRASSPSVGFFNIYKIVSRGFVDKASSIFCSCGKPP